MIETGSNDILIIGEGRASCKEIVKAARNGRNQEVSWSEWWGDFQDRERVQLKDC